MQETIAAASGFDPHVTLADLRRRTSRKWNAYAPDVLPAWIAEMDFACAPPIRAVLRDAVAHDDYGYPSTDALPAAYAAFVARRFGWNADASRVFVLPEVLQGIAEILRATTEPGAGVVVNPPVYGPFAAVVAEVKRRLVDVPLRRPSPRTWALDMDALERAFADGARAYILCSPHNPTGAVFDAATLCAVAELARRYDVLVLSDEIHAPLVLPGTTFVPFLPLAEAAGARAIAFAAATKTWNFAGLKCGLMVAGDAAVGEALRALPRGIYHRAGHLGVLASLAAFTDGDAWLDDLLPTLAANHASFATGLEAALPGAVVTRAAATYLAWIDCEALDLPGAPAKTFLDRGRVALNDGADFGVGGARFVRANLGTSPEIVAEIVRRMAAGAAPHVKG